jgi:pyruvate, water dikinase
VPDDEIFPKPKGYTEAYEVMESFNTIISLIFKAWQFHFEYLNLAYLAYLMFVDTARKLFPGIKESTIGKMVAGADVSMFRPEEELCRLSRLAMSQSPVSNILKKDTSAADKLKELQSTDAGRMWLEELERIKNPWFYVSCGSGWYHYEGSWINKMDVPFSYLKSYVERLEKGEKIERSLTAISEERDRIVEEYRALIKSEDDRKSFDDAYNVVRAIYRYAEDHLFWVEHWLHTIWFRKIREFGNVLAKYDVLKSLTTFTSSTDSRCPCCWKTWPRPGHWAIGAPTRGKYWQEKAAKRKKSSRPPETGIPSPPLGFRRRDFRTLHRHAVGHHDGHGGGWLKGSDAEAKDLNELKGFASSAGIAEGPARVLKSSKTS